MNQVATETEPSRELVTEIDLGSAKGGKAGINREPLVIAPIRPLIEDDLPAIANPPPVGSHVRAVKDLRHSHHRLAQLIAEGKELAEISRVTGYSVTWISNLQTDPAFAELITYYSTQLEAVFVDAAERMKIIGLDAAEILHAKLHDQTEVWSKRELMEVVELALGPSLKPPAGAPGGAGPSPSLSLEVRFVAPPSTDPAAPSGQTLEGSFTDLTPAEPKK